MTKTENKAELTNYLANMSPIETEMTKMIRKAIRKSGVEAFGLNCKVSEAFVFFNFFDGFYAATMVNGGIENGIRLGSECHEARYMLRKMA